MHVTDLELRGQRHASQNSTDNESRLAPSLNENVFAEDTDSIACRSLDLASSGCETATGMRHFIV